MISPVRSPALSQVVLDNLVQGLVYMLVVPPESLDPWELRIAVVVARQAGRAAAEIVQGRVRAIDWLLHVVAPAADMGGALPSDVRRWRAALLQRGGGKQRGNGKVDPRLSAFLAGGAEARPETNVPRNALVTRTVSPGRPLRVRRARVRRR